MRVGGSNPLFPDQMFPTTYGISQSLKADPLGLGERSLAILGHGSRVGIPHSTQPYRENQTPRGQHYEIENAGFWTERPSC